MTDDPNTPLAQDAMTLDDEGLSDMERRFCMAALDRIGKGEQFWRRKAAEDAGYADPRGAAYDLIRRPRVINFISKRMTEATEAINVDQSFVLFRAMTNMAACEAKGDYRTAARYLDTIQRHLRGLTDDRLPNGGGQPGMVSLPFDMSKLSTADLATIVEIMRKAGGGAEPTV